VIERPERPLANLPGRWGLEVKAGRRVRLATWPGGRKSTTMMNRAGPKSGITMRDSKSRKQEARNKLRVTPLERLAG
jgi:hypothetical protein